MAKIAIVPRSPELRALTDRELDLNHQGDGLREAVSEYFQRNEAVWDVQAQLCSNIDDMPIEDAGAVWDEEISPFITVGILTAKPQVSWSPDRATGMDDGLSFRPWNGLAAHRPLGSIMRMRMRRQPYASSAAFRSEHNANEART